MRDGFRTFWLVLSTAFRADPARTVGAVVLESVGRLSMAMLGVWLKLLTDGVLGHDPTRVIAAAIGLATLPPLVTLGGGGGARLRFTVEERTGFAFQRRYAEVAASLRGIGHHELPEFRDKLELLQQNQRIMGNAANALVHSLVVVTQVIITAIIAASLHPILLVLPLFAVPSGIVSASGQRRTKEVEEAVAPLRRRARHLYQLATDPAAGKEARVFGMEPEIRSTHDAAWLEAHAISARLRWRLAASRTLAFAVFAAGFAGAVVFVALQAVRGQATPGDVVLAITLSSQMNDVVSQVIAHMNWVQQSLHNADRFRWLLDLAKAEEAEEAGAPAPPQLADGIRFDGVSFRYPGTETDVLRDVAIRLPAGAIVALVGENGAGKTTLVKLLCRFYDPTEGRILLDDEDLSSVAATSWRERITTGFQDFAKLELLARESVGVGSLLHIDDEPAVAGALERSGGTDVLAALPDGLSTQLGRTWDGGVELSGGQWQKLALGRALMREDPVLTILDEPTASLDAEAEHALFERYAKAARSRTERGAITVLVSHRFSTVRTADLIVVLDGGRVVESGSHEELMSNGGLYSELFTLQARQYT